MRFHAKLLGKPKKPKLSVVEAKKAAKLLQGLGKTVPSIQVASDGSFVVNAADPSATALDTGNSWDEVLIDGKA